jgi:hypothetical protein
MSSEAEEIQYLKDEEAAMTNREQAIEKIITDKFCNKCAMPDKAKRHCAAGNPCHYVQGYKDALLNLESLGMCFKAKDQSLPVMPRYLGDIVMISRIEEDAYKKAQQVMLTPDKNGCVWVKVEKE